MDLSKPSGEAPACPCPCLGSTGNGVTKQPPKGDFFKRRSIPTPQLPSQNSHWELHRLQEHLPIFTSLRTRLRAEESWLGHLAPVFLVLLEVEEASRPQQDRYQQKAGAWRRLQTLLALPRIRGGCPPRLFTSRFPLKPFTPVCLNISCAPQHQL